VIHALGGEQDMRKMGGLRKYIPVTFWTMTAATLAISGFPGFSGFFSKDEILFRAYVHGPSGWILWLIGLITAFLTAFYMFRLWFLTFFGEYRGGTGHDQHPGREEHHGHAPHESPKVMLIPLVILAILSVIGGWVGVSKAMGGSNHFEHYLAPIFEHEEAAPESAALAPQVEPSTAMELKLSIDATVAALAGIGLAWLFYYKRRDLPEKVAASLHGLYVAIENKYFVDEFYGAAIVKPLILGSTYLLWKGIDVGVIDRTINDSADAARDVSRGFRQMQSGNIRSYAGWVAAGAAAVVVFMIWKGTR
jgi:NADH-quinone oxidoreductase subunit L